MPDPVGVGGVLRLLADEPEIIAGARWRDVSRDLGAAGTLVSDRGQLQLRGWTEQLRVRSSMPVLRSVRGRACS